MENADGKITVDLDAPESGNGLVTTYNGSTGKSLVGLTATTNCDGMVMTYASTCKSLVMLGARDSGGGVEVYNKTGEAIVTLDADEYGNG